MIFSKRGISLKFAKLLEKNDFEFMEIIIALLQLWSGIPESDRCLLLGREMYCHYTNPAVVLDCNKYEVCCQLAQLFGHSRF